MHFLGLLWLWRLIFDWIEWLKDVRACNAGLKKDLLSFVDRMNDPTKIEYYLPGEDREDP
jgi:hypothetical protein